MTYNVHGCVGTDGRLDEGRIATVIAEASPDVVALQELDVERKRSGGLHQARHLAERLKMDFYFHPALTRLSEQYGDAILSRLPMTLVQKGMLPTSKSRLAFEPRGALMVKITVDGGPVHLLNTHLGLSWDERMAQITAILGPEWMKECMEDHPFILCGDLNALPGSQVYRTITRRLKDVQRWSLRSWPHCTFPSRWPLTRLDYIFMNRRLAVRSVEVPSTRQTQLASDHLPLIADLVLTPG